MTEAMADEDFIRRQLGLPTGLPKKQIKHAWHTPERWQIIRDYYAKVTPMILRGERPGVYELGLYDFLTPIEVYLWEEIRTYGLPFYMQYPVGRRFVDFGDPVKKIALEADGKAYHTPEGDAEKNAALAEHGWMVFRFTGSEIYKSQNLLRDVLRWYGRNYSSED